MIRQRLVKECVIGLQYIQYATIILDQVGQETCDLFLHVVANIDKGWKMSFAFLIEGCHIAHVQPLTAKLEG